MANALITRFNMRPRTLCIHGNDSHERAIGAPVEAPIVTANSFFTAPDAVAFSALDLKDDAPYSYSRWANPTVARLERRIAALEHAEAAICFASGMSAITGLLLTRLKVGDHLIASDVCYAGAAEFIRDALPRLGIRVTTVDTSDPANVAAAMTPETRLVYLETPANPTLRLADIAAIARVTHDAGAELCVDSTIATPLATWPITLGADYVIHSLTKYIGGHGDTLGGVIACYRDKAAELRVEALIHHGGVLNPMAAWLIGRGLETLTIRMREHESNARGVAEYLSKHPRVRSVYWPGLASHPQHELARRQMRNFSGVLSFVANGDSSALAKQFADRLRVFSYAFSLGSTKSLFCYIQTDEIMRTSFRLTGTDAVAYRTWAGDGVFRVSVGLEDVHDLIADLDQAMQ
jgi:cystathionine gamma-synthase